MIVLPDNKSTQVACRKIDKLTGFQHRYMWESHEFTSASQRLELFVPKASWTYEAIWWWADVWWTPQDVKAVSKVQLQQQSWSHISDKVACNMREASTCQCKASGQNLPSCINVSVMPEGFKFNSRRYSRFFSWGRQARPPASAFLPKSVSLAKSSKAVKGNTYLHILKLLELFR